MPHGPINSVTNIFNTAFFRHNGVVEQTASQKAKVGWTVYPASVKNPLVLGFRKPSAWNATVFRLFTSEGSIRWVNNTNPLDTWSASGQLSTINEADLLPLVTYDPKLADYVLQKCLSEMLENDVAFNAFLLQGKQSLSMVANLATGIAHGTDNLMTANFKSPKKFRRFLANASEEAVSNFSGKYLEYLYGWAPLAEDVENAFQSMIDGYTGPEKKQFRMSVRKSKKVKSEVDITRSASTYYTAPFMWTQTLLKENRAKVVLHYEFPAQAGEMLPTMTPFGTAWELTPWSFVVDWFIPIGDWIGAMEATQYAVYMKNAVLTQSAKVASSQKFPSRWTTVPITSGVRAETIQCPRFSGQGFLMDRKVLSPIAVLDRIRFPDFSSKFGLPQASQALALLSQVFSKWF